MKRPVLETQIDKITHISTFNGNVIDLQNPNPKDIDLEGLVRGLFRTPRSAGQGDQFYTAGQHSLLAIDITEVLHPKDRVLQLEVLLHDASEGFLQDMITPAKNLMPGYRIVETNLTHAINLAVGHKNVPQETYEERKFIDRLALAIERTHNGPYYDLELDKPWVKYFEEVTNSKTLHKTIYMNTTFQNYPEKVLRDHFLEKLGILLVQTQKYTPEKSPA